MENIKIQKIENITERRTKITALAGEGIDAEEMIITLLGEDLAAHQTGDKQHFIEAIESLKKSYRGKFRELTDYVASYRDDALWDDWATDNAREHMNELEGISYQILWNQVALKSME